MCFTVWPEKLELSHMCFVATLFRQASQPVKMVNVTMGSPQQDLLHYASRFLLLHAKPTFTDNDSRGWLESLCALFGPCSCCQSFAV